MSLQITFTTLDSISQEDEADVRFDLDVGMDWLRTEDEIIAFVRETITQAELHERDEWLRYKDELIDDPHGPGRNGKVEVTVA